MRSILKEPLLHFLLIGAALFLSFGLLDEKTPGGGDNQVVVSAGMPDQVKMTTQERAYTSPIWYTP